VWRHHSVHRCERGDCWDADIDIGRPLEVLVILKLARNTENKRQHDDKADLEKHRNADDKRDKRHRPGRYPVGRPAQDRVSDRLGNAGISQDLSQHRTQSDDEADSSQCLACSVDRRLDDRTGIHAGDKTNRYRDNEQGEQGMQANARHDERNEEQNASDRREQQLDVKFRHACFSLHDTICASRIGCALYSSRCVYLRSYARRALK